MLTAVDFSKRLAGDSGATFGVSEVNTANELRELASKIERGEVYLQRVSVSSKAMLEDFTMTRLMITVHETKNQKLPRGMSVA